MKNNLSWIIVPHDNKSHSPEEWNELIEIESKVDAKIRPTKKSAMKLAEKLAKEFDYPIEIYWKRGRKSWKYNMVYENS